MSGRIAAVGFIIASLAAGAPGVTAREKVSLRVTPAVSQAPAYVRVIAQVERDATNRLLEITADSTDFFSSSTINLEGEEAPRTTEIALKHLPRGEYTISAVLVDDLGRRTTAQRSVIVLAGMGER